LACWRWVVHRRAQDAARARLHDAAASGQLKGFVHAYLGMNDQHAPVPMPDLLVPVTKIKAYPTDFRAMTDTDIQLIATRGSS
jgi:NTE family protein